MRKRQIAILLAFLTGPFGGHKFYLGRTFSGFVYLFITIIFFNKIFGYIPLILAWIQAITWSGMSDQEFDRKYNYKNTSSKNKRTSSTKRTPDEEPTNRPTVIQRNTPTLVSANSKKVAQLKKEGLKYYKEFKYAEAIQVYQEALLIKPKDPSIHFNLACIYSLLENVELAYEHIYQAVKNGFKEIETINNHEALAFLRVHPQFEEFKNNQYSKVPENILPNNSEENKELEENYTDEEKTKSLPNPAKSDILEELRQLERLRILGVLTDKEYEEQKRILQEK